MSITNKDYKIIFMGTPEFSVPFFSALLDNYNVVAAITQPDKKVGRKQVFTPSAVKKLSREKKITILQPAVIKGNQEFINKIKKLEPDLIIVVAYGFILPKEILTIPKFGVINVHSSLLPKYRGASPMQSALLNGDMKTGVTIMLLNEKMDEGDILAQAEAVISTDETLSSLHDKLSILGTHLLIDTLPKYLNQEIKPMQQDKSKATYCQLITKQDGKIDWSKSATEIERQIRALNPWPGTWTNWADKKLKIHKVEKIDSQNSKIGQLLKYKDGLAVQCGQEALQILELQMEGKKIMTAKEFINGYPKIINSLLQ